MKPLTIHRSLPPPNKSFLLFGPRGTGKSTWVKENIRAEVVIDLLKSREYLAFATDPGLLHERLAHLKAGDWAVIDEVQRVPDLLSEVHALYEEKRIHFALTGSSARKLKRGGADLLAGRALQLFLFPMTYEEYKGIYSPEQAVQWGTLPLVITDFENRKDTLATYVETYLRQEIIEEGFVRKAEPFVRFLEIAGILNGQVLNVENVAREARIKRTTVDNYFQILEDTLIGTRLPAYQPAIKIKEVSHTKFYLFDVGVARACAGLFDHPLSPEWKGIAIESYLLHELRAYGRYRKKHAQLSFYRISGSYEIDFIIELKKKSVSQPAEIICIEAKSAKKWDRRWGEAMDDLESQSKVKVKAKYGVYLGADTLKAAGTSVLPLEVFLQKLWCNEIF